MPKDGGPGVGLPAARLRAMISALRASNAAIWALFDHALSITSRISRACDERTPAPGRRTTMHKTIHLKPHLREIEQQCR